MLKKSDENRELKQNERIQNRENVVEDINVGYVFELATNNINYVNGLDLHQIKPE